MPTLKSIYLGAKNVNSETMKKYTYFDDTFDISHTNNYELTLQLGLCGYSFCVNSLLSNKCVAIGRQDFGGVLDVGDLPKRLTDFLKSQEFLTKNFSRVNFVFATVKSTLVSDEFFDATKVKELFNFNHKITTDENLEYIRIEKLGLVQVFSSPASLATVMVNRFKDVRFYHQASALLANFSLLLGNKAEASVLVNFTDELMDILVQKEGALLLHNTYEIDSATDRLYYLSNVLKQLNLPVDTTPVYLAGQIEEGDVTDKLFKEYFSQLKFYTSLNKEYVLATAKHALVNLINF